MSKRLLLCPANCGRSFASDRAINSHLTQAVSCQWYRQFSKTPVEHLDDTVEQFDLDDEEGTETIRSSSGELGESSIDGEGAGEMLQELEEENDVFHFVRLDEALPMGEAGPGPSTQAHRDRMADRQLGARIRSLDDGDLSMFEVEHRSGGAVIRMDDSLHTRWRVAHNLPVDVPMDGSSPPLSNLFAPFASELDWRIAEWVVKDNIGHNSFNCLLQIPGVCLFHFLMQCCISHVILR